MAIDQFDTKRFEAALPVDRQTGKPLWKCEGYVQGEMVYSLPIQRNDGLKVRLMIRSSIDYSGKAAATGMDSIRMWLEASNGALWNGVGKDATTYTTRVKGWEARMTERIRYMYVIGRKLNTCPVCNGWKVMRVVQKQSANRGRVFSVCTNCERGGKDKQFEFLTDPDPKAVEKYGIKAG